MGASDCELLHDGWLAQPVNAWSNAAFAVAAAYVLVQARRCPTPVRRRLRAGATALAMLAVGSFAFHGPQPAWAPLAHDAAIAVLLGALLLVIVRRGVVVAATGLSVVVLAAVPWSALAVHGSLTAALAVAEIRAGAAAGKVARRVARWALSLGALAWVLGRTDGPLCSPGSSWQAHAVWHLLAAVAAAAALVSRARPGRTGASPATASRPATATGQPGGA